ncbi:unnamed protein product [Caenorhabditis angaria]|uniref:Uncharacterized protein n=1 Tax=Caenorhabditis angaria TaxID=860376 RepID=A0A9P1IER1_9PELO|nr:unnamed protein product [Caenorhabditis angaria]
MDLSHFDQVVESCLEKLMKPDLAFYRLVEARLGLSGPDLVFLDDLEENLEAARQLGWRTIKVEEDVRPAIRELEELTGLEF